jgi:peroxiredoxin
MKRITFLFVVLAFSACDNSKNGPAATSATAEPGAGPAAQPNEPPQPGSAAVAAAVGQPAPDFTLVDTDGKTFKLSEQRGKTVVLEWFNPGCPFVKASHTKGSLVTTASRHAKDGVVWVAINSGAPGKQGAGKEANVEAARSFNLSHPVLLDEAGTVGRAYGAARTPEMYVIDKKGTLVYAGAIDNSPDGEGESPTDGKLVNYVDEALLAVKADKPVATAKTEAYGCSVKYAK